MFEPSWPFLADDVNRDVINREDIKAPARRDPRLFQVLALGILLTIGACYRDFSLRREQVILTFLAAIATQALTGLRRRDSSPQGINSARPTGCVVGAGLAPRFASKAAYLSVLITSLSVAILLRADNLWVHPAAAATAIASKSVIRFRAKHLFNPADLGVMLGLLLLPGTWVSAGQWGNDLALAGWFMMLGAVVVNRACRGDVSWTFLAFYLGALAARVMWLGQNPAVWTHQLENGALLLFAFFMISDPRTAPDHPRGRIAHAALVAAIAYVWQFELYRTNALLWALFLATPAVPFWDAIWPARRFEWNSKGGHDEAKLETLSSVCSHAADRHSRRGHAA